MLRKRSVLALTLLFFAGLSRAEDVKVGSLEISAPWARATPKGAAIGGGYLKITNAGTTADRLALALELLRDPAFDALLTGESRFDELPDVMARLATGSLPAVCHTITYGEG